METKVNRDLDSFHVVTAVTNVELKAFANPTIVQHAIIARVVEEVAKEVLNRHQNELVKAIGAKLIKIIEVI